MIVLRAWSTLGCKSWGVKLNYSTSVKDKYRILFFGTDSFSTKTLQYLHDDMSKAERSRISQLEVCCVKLKSDVSKFAQAHQLKMHHWPLDVDNIQGRYDLGVVSSFGKLIPASIINSFPRGVLNVHGSLLPRWRGASPIAHALMHGDTKTGISIMDIRPHKFDIGKVLAQKEHQIHAEIKRQELIQELAVVGAELMLRVLYDLDHFQRQAWEQDETKVTYAPLINSSFFDLDWSQVKAEELWNRYRGLNQLGKFRCQWMDTNELVRVDDMDNPSGLLKFQLDSTFGSECLPGRTVCVRGKKGRFVCIKCKSGWVNFNKFWVGHRKIMTARDFFNGFISKYQGEKELYFGPS